jgi:hypothetical protein
MHGRRTYLRQRICRFGDGRILASFGVGSVFRSISVDDRASVRSVDVQGGAVVEVDYGHVTVAPLGLWQIHDLLVR